MTAIAGNDVPARDTPAPTRAPDGSHGWISDESARGVTGDSTRERTIASDDAVDADADLDERYGRAPRDKRRIRRWAIAAACAFTLVIGAWLVWGGVIDGLDTVDGQNIGHTVLSDSEVEVTWQLTIQPGQATSCALQALNDSFGIVGWKVVDLPASSQRTRSLTDIVRTSEQSVTGLIYRCWRT